MNPIRFAMIGAGQISHSCARALAGRDDVELVAVADPSQERRSKLAESYGLARHHDDNQAVIAAEDIDAVYVAVPNKFHAPLAQACLEAGKHVILDKPFAMNHGEALAAAAAARSGGKTLMLGMNQRFTRESQSARRVVEQGRLGEIYHAKARWLRRAGIPKLGTWFSSRELAGGGALYDIGVHLLDLALHLVGEFEPVAVSGKTYTRFGDRGLGEGGWGQSERAGHVFDVDDFATALIKLASGATVTLDVSWALHQAEANVMGIELFGTEAGLSTPPLTLYHPGDEGYQAVQLPQQEPYHAHGDRFVHFVEVLKGEAEPFVTLDQALAVQRILDAIAESCQSGRDVVIGA